MYRSSIVFTLTVLLGAAAGQAANVSGTHALGFAISNGDFRINDATVSGNATVMDGAVLETLASVSHVSLKDGARIDFGTESRGHLYANRMVLERGVGQVKSAGSYAVQADGLEIRPGTQSMATIAVAGPREVRVTAFGGDVSVRNSSGLLVARVLRGTTMAFSPQEAGAAGPSQFTGCIQKVKVGDTIHYVLRDETTNAVIELTGPDVAANVGKSVQVAGAVNANGTPVAGATQLVEVSSITHINRHGCRSEIAAVADAASIGAGLAAGLSAGATVAIIGGVAAGATIGGLAAAGTFSGGTTAPVSVF